MTPAPSTNATLAAMRAQRVALARTDLASFLEFVLRDESSGRSIALAPFHEEQIRLTQAHRRLVLWAAIEHGKSSLHTVGRVLFELGCDPTKRIAVVSNTQGQARKFIAAITRYIETSPELAEVFPHLKPGSRWGADAITVARRSFAKDPSVQGIGVHGNVLGARLDLIIMDDVLDFESCRTDEQRRLTIDWTHATLLGRLVEHGRIVVLGTAQHPSDLMHYLAANGWPAYRFAVEDEHGLPRWPERWSEKRIAEKRVELGPMEAARQLDCLARADSSSRFQESWIVDACRRGLGRPPVPYILNVRPPSFTVCGVDLAVSEKRNSDLTAISSVLVHGNGHRELLAVETGKWSAPEILKRIQRVNAAYQPRLVVVESNAAQMYISAMLREWTSIPVKSFITGRGRMSLAWQAESLATELSNGKWTIRGEDTKETAALIRDMLFYDPRAHTGDRLASLLMARWGCEQSGLRVESLPGLDFNRR